MRKSVVLALLLPFIAGTAFAERREYEIKPRTYDPIPNDGISDPGSYSNPYEIRQNGSTVGTIQPKYPDLFPGDGIGDPGTYSNPTVIRQRNGGVVTIRPKYPDIFPGDGIGDEGTWDNPTVVSVEGEDEEGF